MTLVEAPNGQLYTHWIRNFAFGSSSGYKRIADWSMVVGYRGEIIVLNGGSLDPHIRNGVLSLAAIGEISITKVQV